MKNPHPRLVRLLGYCIEGDKLCLVYEFMKGGSLQSLLDDPERMRNLTAEQRIRIALDIGVFSFSIISFSMCEFIQQLDSISFIPKASFILTSNQATFCLMKTIEHSLQIVVLQEFSVVMAFQFIFPLLIIFRKIDDVFTQHWNSWLYCTRKYWL